MLILGSFSAFPAYHLWLLSYKCLRSESECLARFRVNALFDLFCALFISFGVFFCRQEKCPCKVEASCPSLPSCHAECVWTTLKKKTERHHSIVSCIIEGAHPISIVPIWSPMCLHQVHRAFVPLCISWWYFVERKDVFKSRYFSGSFVVPPPREGVFSFFFTLSLSLFSLFDLKLSLKRNRFAFLYRKRFF